MPTLIHVTNPTGGSTEYEENQLHTLWQSGKIQTDALYWRDGMTDWRPLSELFNPYSYTPAPPPLPSPETTAVFTSTQTTGYRYTKDPQKLTSFLILMQRILLAAEVIVLFSDLAELSLLNRAYTEEEGEANDTRQGLIGIAYLVITIIAGITFLKWVYRANLNSRGFGAQSMRFTPGWCIGYYFIPFLNLVRPYQSMKEIWQVSQNPARWQTQESSSLLSIWWGLSIVTGILGQIVFRTSMSANDIPSLKNSTTISCFSSVVEIILLIVTLKVIASIAQNQENLVKGQ